MAKIALKGRTAVAPHRTPESERKNWSGSEARRQARNWAGITGLVSEATPAQRRKLARAFAFVASPGDSMADYKLPHHYVENGRLVVNRRGLQAVGGAVQGARGGVQIPAADIRGVRTHLGQHFRALGLEPPWAGSRRAESREDDPKTQIVSRQAPLAGLDALKRKIYYILSRADDPDSNDMTMDADEVERSSDRFMLSIVQGWGNPLSLNHMCANCDDTHADHHLGASVCACRVDGCVCTVWEPFTVEALKLVENFIFGGTDDEGKVWHGIELTEPFKMHDHIVAVRVEDDSLFEFLSEGSSISWEAEFEIVVNADEDEEIAAA